ncbi:tRNA lysidine(34) synthetase TilS [Mycoplasmopsis edwardii]|uniref:tRNA lysidine(34) synthetase TilS n=1 Tax=Mycoplasmopsis edwardii TaxID=53558 RepID=A0ACD4PJS7_9BACT|nr:tRNA lysidine(34) synthetase TilS [Mycoplasmopsis edwardii]WBP84019.1 tRNA lysidine(34) synthetase TilS [Mycoplasmopsis edwardii]
MNKKYLIAVSGGPDSMYLLNKYKDKDVVVATVNYNQRHDSGVDFNIVKDFCKLYNIKFEGLNLNKPDYTGGNFQNWAREKRYKFFKEIYKKYNCNELLIGHNIDDFLETAIYQSITKRINKYYGIKRTNNLYEMNINRPLINKYFKKTIVKKCINLGIPFHVDYTNDTDKYFRNKIRLENNKLLKFTKLMYFIKFKLINLFNKVKWSFVNRNYKKWERSEFSQDSFEFLKFKDQLIFDFINNNYFGIKLSKNKISNISKFIVSKNRTQRFKLEDNVFLDKKKGKLIRQK